MLTIGKVNMSDDIDNNAAAVAAYEARNPDSPLLKELESLRARLAELEQRNVVQADFGAEMPLYKLNETCYLADTLLGAGMTVEWADTPNLSMVPLNEPAKRAMQDHLQHMEEGQRMVAQMTGRPFAGLMTDHGVLIAQGLHDVRNQAADLPKLRIPEERGVVPVMPHLPEAQAMAKRGPGRPRKLGNVTPPPEPTKAIPTWAPQAKAG